MKIFRKRPAREASLGLLQDAMGQVQPGEDRSGDAAPGRHERVRTAQGRKAHLADPGGGVLCGWRAGSWQAADATLPLCRLCQVMGADVAQESRSKEKAS